MSDQEVSAQLTKLGRPFHVPTEETRHLIEALSAFGWSQRRIAAALRISRPTLNRYYLASLRCGRDRLEVRLAATLLDQIEAGSVKAIMAVGRRLRALP